MEFTQKLNMADPNDKIWNLLTVRCNNFMLRDSSSASCVKFLIDGHFVGLIHQEFCAHLLNYADVFIACSDSNSDEPSICLNEKLKTFSERTEAVEGVMQMLRNVPQLTSLEGWRNEHYGIFIGGRSHALMSIERAASRILGINRHNVHINGYTYLSDEFEKKSERCTFSLNEIDEGCPIKLFNVPPNLRIWIARRSPNRPKWPGLLDNLAAGGLTYGLTALQCAKKETMEEAGVPKKYLDSMKSAGSVSSIYDDDEGVGSGVAFCFDLELPSDFQPSNVDKEVEEFHLVTLPEVAKLIASEHFKPNSAMVVLDFLIRRGFVDPDENSLYEKWQQWMHVKLPFD